MPKLMQKSNTRQELLDNTVRHFNSNNRSATSDEFCKYRLTTDIGCAIGRELTSKLAFMLDKHSTTSVKNDAIFGMLPKRLQKMGKAFLEDIQVLHDIDDNWNKNGLSRIGKLEVKSICNEYKLQNPLKK